MTSTISTVGDSDEKLAELLTLLEGADSVELKLTVPLSDGHRGSAALGVDPLGARIREVYFFDTPDLALNENGVVVRARRVQGKAHDSVVKLRPVVPSSLPSELRSSPSFGVEVDAMPGSFVCSGSMKHSLGTMDVRDALAGKKTLTSSSRRSSVLCWRPARPVLFSCQPRRRRDGQAGTTPQYREKPCTRRTRPRS